MGIGDFDFYTEFESRLLKWISASDFVEVAWSTKRAADAFKVEEKDVYEALAGPFHLFQLRITSSDIL